LCHRWPALAIIARTAERHSLSQAVGWSTYRGPPGRTAGYSKIALTIMAANAIPATTPAKMAANNSNMNSPIVDLPTACRRRGRALLCCNARSPRAWRGGTFGRFSVYCGYGPGTSRLVAGALSRLQSAAPALTQRAKALAGAPEPARVERSCQRNQRLSAPANPLSRSLPDPIRRSENRQNALEAIQ
jgi:hypothetical protein